jgi:hypothetical protein
MAGYRWPKGVSGNPRGRKPSALSLAERIRERVDPDEMIDIWMEIARGKTVTVGNDEDGNVTIIVPRVSDRIAALNALAERGWMKPPTSMQVEAVQASPIDFARLSEEQLVAFGALLDAASGDEASGERQVIDVAAGEEQESER